MAQPQDRSSGNAFCSSLRQCASMVRRALANYEDMIVKDPQFTSKLETALRIASYIIPGRFGGSWELSELAFSISNLYSLGNDYLITRRCPPSSNISKCPELQQSLLWLLSLLDCVEVAVEMMTQRFAGEPGKWGVVILMQIVRAVLRGLLVFKHRHGLTCSPPVPPPDRKTAQTLHSAKPLDGDGQPLAWKGPRTGKIVRSIHADDSVPYSQLQHYVAPPSPPASQSAAARADLMQARKPLTRRQLIAEALYIARPLVHIVSMILFGQDSWKPWTLSLSADVISLQLLGGPTCYVHSVEKAEVVRRRVVLLLYIVRSPLYDNYTRSLLVELLKSLSAKLPLVHHIVVPMLEYLPVWQQTYSYNWMT